MTRISFLSHQNILPKTYSSWSDVVSAGIRIITYLETEQFEIESKRARELYRIANSTFLISAVINNELLEIVNTLSASKNLKKSAIYRIAMNIICSNNEQAQLEGN